MLDYADLHLYSNHIDFRYQFLNANTRLMISADITTKKEK